MSSDRDRLIARIAAQFARERDHAHIDEIAPVAIEAADLAIAVRDRACASRSARLAAIAATYDAIVVERHDPDGMAVGFKFYRGRFTSGHRDIMYLV